LEKPPICIHRRTLAWAVLLGVLCVFARYYSVQGSRFKVQGVERGR
jgi:hypothetical protein